MNITGVQPSAVGVREIFLTVSLNFSTVVAFSMNFCVYLILNFLWSASSVFSSLSRVTKSSTATGVSPSPYLIEACASSSLTIVSALNLLFLISLATTRSAPSTLHSFVLMISEIYKELLSVYKCKEGQIICVCSPNQVMRKTFIYLRYGIEVMCHSVPIPGKMMYHNPVWEYFGSLYKAVYSNNDWQNPENDQFIESRKSRSPRSLLNP